MQECYQEDQTECLNLPAGMTAHLVETWIRQVIQVPVACQISADLWGQEAREMRQETREGLGEVVTDGAQGMGQDPALPLVEIWAWAEIETGWGDHLQVPEKDPGQGTETAEDLETEITAWGQAVLVEWTVEAEIITEWTAGDKITVANAPHIILRQVDAAVEAGVVLRVPTRDGQVEPVAALIITAPAEGDQGHPSAHPHQVGLLKVEPGQAEGA